MIDILDTIDTITHVRLLKDYYQIEPKIEWIDFVPQSKQFYLQLDDEHTIKSIIDNTTIEIYIKKYNLFRTRLLWLGPKSCYSLHRDFYKRIQIPLITNDQCFFVFKNGLVEHIPIGHICLVDSTLDHTAINGSDQWRLHLVGDLRD
jgi:hypothetical protein